MMRPIPLNLASIALVVFAGACDNDPAAPVNPLPVVGSQVGGTTGAVFSHPSDTTNRTLVGPSVIHGDVVLLTALQGSGGGVDTSQTAPLAGAVLTLSQQGTDGSIRIG